MLTSIFGLMSIFFDVTCSKISKHAIFGKSDGKVLEKWGGGKKKKLCQNENFGSLTSIL